MKDSNRPKLFDKAKKMKHKGVEVEHKTSSDITEDKGKMPEYHEFSQDGAPVAGFVKKDKKVVQSVATQDAQDSGLFEAAAKKAGDKDPIFTSADMAAAKAGVVAKKKQGKMGEAKSPLQEKILKGSSSKKDKLSKASTDQGMGGSKLSSLIHRTKSKIADKYAKGAITSLIHRLRLEDEHKEPDLQKADDDTKTPTLDYSKMNKQPVKEAKTTLDYSKLGPAPEKDPRWKRDQAVKREQKVKELTATHQNLITNKKHHTPKTALDTLRERASKNAPVRPRLGKADEDQAQGKEMPKSDDSQMTHDQLLGVVHHVNEIMNKLDANKDLPDWVKAKITNAFEALSSTAHYIDANEQPE